MYFPAFYATRELVMNEKPDLAKAMMLYKDNMSEDLAALWKVRETNLLSICCSSYNRACALAKGLGAEHSVKLRVHANVSGCTAMNDEISILRLILAAQHRRWARVPWVAGTSLIWTCILSAMRGGDVSHKQDLESPFPTGVTLTLFREGLDEMFACPVESDSSTAHVCILGSGPDRVGRKCAQLMRVLYCTALISFSASTRIIATNQTLQRWPG